VSRSLLTAKCALAGVVKRGVSVSVDACADDFELAPDLRTGDVIEEEHLTGFFPCHQVDLEPELVVVKHDGDRARDGSRVHLIPRIHERAVEVEDGCDVIRIRPLKSP
jgi:hypothetical protein